MLVLTWLVMFALVGFNLVGTIPAPTPNRILRSKSSPEDQIVKGKSLRINLPASRLPNWYHASCAFIGDISTPKNATRNRDLNILSKASPYLSAIAVDQARSQSSRLLLQERQVCNGVCGSAKVSPYITPCCEENEYCTTVNGIPACYYSTIAESQAFSSTYSTPTDVTPISSSQTRDLSSAMERPSSTAEELSTTPSTFIITVTTSISTSQSSSAVSDTQTSIGPVLTSSTSKTSVTAASSTTQISGLASSNTAGTMTTYSPTFTPSSTPSSSTPLAAGGLSPGDIVGIVSGVLAAIGVVAGIIFGVRQWNKKAPGDRAVRDVGSWFCGCRRSYHHDEIHMGRYPQQNIYP